MRTICDSEYNFHAVNIACAVARLSKTAASWWRGNEPSAASKGQFCPVERDAAICANNTSFQSFSHHMVSALPPTPNPSQPPPPPSPLAVTIGNDTAAFVERDPPQPEGTQSVRPGAGLGGLAQNADQSAEPSCDSQKLNEEIEGEE